MHEGIFIQRVVSLLREVSPNVEETTLCKRKGVAAIGYSLDKTIICTNGPVNNARFLCSGEQGNCGCIHAETRLCAKINESPPRTWIVGMNYSPCVPCAHQLIVTSRIGTVVWLKMATHHPRAPQLLSMAGIRIIQIEKD